MLRTRKTSPARLPILETGLLIRDLAEKIQQNESVPSNSSPPPWDHPGGHRNTAREEEKGREREERRHSHEGPSHFLSLALWPLSTLQQRSQGEKRLR